MPMDSSAPTTPASARGHISTAPMGYDRPIYGDDHPRPYLDDDLLLWWGERWVALTDLQAPVASLLLDRFGQIVTAQEVAHCYLAAGGSDSPAAIRSVMFRVAQRLVEVGLAVTFASRRTGMVVHFRG